MYDWTESMWGWLDYAEINRCARLVISTRYGGCYEGGDTPNEAVEDLKQRLLERRGTR